MAKTLDLLPQVIRLSTAISSFKLNRGFALVILCCVTFSALALGKAPSSAEMLNIPLHAQVITFNPSKIQDSQSLLVARQINCQLFRLNRKVAEPEAAESAKYIDPTTIEITLRDHLQFSDGTPVLASDVSASFEDLRQNRSVLRNIFAWVGRIEVRNKRTLLLHLKTPFSRIIDFLGAPNYAIFPERFLKGARSHPENWQTPIGCGSYKVDLFDVSRGEIRLEPIKKAAIPVVFSLRTGTPLSEKEISSAAILDYPFSNQTLPTELFSEATTFDPRQIYLALNTRQSAWKERQVRCDLFREIDRSGLLSSYKGKAVIATSLFPEGVIGYKSETKLPWSSSVKKQSVGANKKFNLTILGLSVAADLRPAYVELIAALDFKTTLSTMSDPSNFGANFAESLSDGLIYGFKSNYLDGYEFLLPFVEKSANASSFVDQTLIDIVNQSQKLPDPVQRAKQYQIVEKKILNECVLYPLITVPDRRVFVRNKFEMPGVGEVPINEYDLSKVRIR